MTRDAVRDFWDDARRVLSLPHGTPCPPVWHFCDNQEDADTCLSLVLSGTKTATAPSIAELTAASEPVPRVGDLDIVTDFAGRPGCVIRTVSAEITPFSAVGATFAEAEGQGDRTLKHWRRVHEAYYRRVLSGTGTEFSPSLPIVQQRFEVVARPER